MPTAAAQQKASGPDQLGTGHLARVVADQKRKYPTLPHPFSSSSAVHVPSGATFYTGVRSRSGFSPYCSPAIVLSEDSERIYLSNAFFFLA